MLHINYLQENISVEAVNTSEGTDVGLVRFTGLVGLL